MKSQTSLVAENVRLQEWALQIQECQSRPRGTSVDDWCESNHITKANYYYRLRRVREACLDALPPENLPAFVELPVPVEPVRGVQDGIQTSSAVIVTPEGLRIELSDSASDKFIRTLLGAISHAK